MAAGVLRPLGLGDVLDGMFRLFLRHWRAYLLALGAVLVPVTLLTTWLQQDLVVGAGLLEILDDPLAAQEAAAADPLVDLVAGLGGQLAVSLLVSPLIAGIATVLAVRGFLGEAVTASGALGTAGRRYLPLVVANLLTVVAVGATALVIAVPFVLLVVATGAEGVVIVIAVLLGLPVAGLATLAVYVLLLVAVPAIIVERAGPLAALGRSAALVRRRFWAVLGTWLVVWLIAAVISNVFVWPFTLPATLFGGTTALVATALGGIVGGLLAAPLVPNALTLVYYDLRVRTEALDLEAMATALERGEGAGPA
ncbi:MAG: hypothetical protein ACQETV_04335 [Actinomycetota bacterium]